MNLEQIKIASEFALLCLTQNTLGNFPFQIAGLSFEYGIPSSKIGPSVCVRSLQTMQILTHFNDADSLAESVENLTVMSQLF